MICYKDKTFCKLKDCQYFHRCDRSFTQEVIESAKKWWGNDNPPMAIFMGKPKCYVGKSCKNCSKSGKIEDIKIE